MINTYKFCRLDCKVALFPMTSGIAPPPVKEILTLEIRPTMIDYGKYQTEDLHKVFKDNDVTELGNLLPNNGFLINCL